METLLIICPLVFLAGFVDAIAGGGGLISLPAYLFAGLPVHIAGGTNKFAMSLGTMVSAGRFLKAGKLHHRVALVSAIGAVVGAFLGTNLALLLSEKLLKLIILVALPCVAVFVGLKKDLGGEEKQYSKKKTACISLFIGLVIGCYDGLIGPGTGTFLIIAYGAFLGIDLLTASGSAKIPNLASNIASLVVYIWAGKVLFWLALPAAACAMLGNSLGARFALKKGAEYVRYVIFVVIGLLFIKLLFDFIAA